MQHMRSEENKLMINVILGICTGIAGSILYFKGIQQVWYVWMFFILGPGFIIFSVDVLTGSIKEHETRAALVGVLLFLIPGTVFMGLSFVVGF